jgi:hypothetical protein
MPRNQTRPRGRRCKCRRRVLCSRRANLKCPGVLVTHRDVSSGRFSKVTSNCVFEQFHISGVPPRSKIRMPSRRCILLENSAIRSLRHFLCIWLLREFILWAQYRNHVLDGRGGLAFASVKSNENRPRTPISQRPCHTASSRRHWSYAFANTPPVLQSSWRARTPAESERAQLLCRAPQAL